VITQVDVGRHSYLVLTTDITRQRRRQEQIRMIDRLTDCLQGSLDLERVLYLTLVCVTAGHTLGFSRAFIFLLSDDGGVLKGSRAAGPISEEKAERLWASVSESGQMEVENDGWNNDPEGEVLTGEIRSLEIPVEECGVCANVLQSGDPFVVVGGEKAGELHVDLRQRLGLDECVVVPLISADTALGVMIADHKLSDETIEDEGVEQLRVFATQASMAIANARAYRRIEKHVEKLKKTQQKLVESERMASVGRMAARLAHQMRTPLALIGGYAQAIMRAAEEGTQIYSNAEIIYEEEQSLESEINETLEVSRPLEPEVKPEDFNELVTESVNRVSCDDVHLSLSLGENMPPVPVDADLIQQAIINLVDNACQAVKNQSRCRVRVRTLHDEEKAELIVSDTGQGIDEEVRQKIFAPFFTTKKEGTGLGLAITRRIVREHGGTVWCRSKRGKGATFGIKLPFKVEESSD
ncbi:MAG: ATP-binding protein, partial [Planctomycetota bacterium]